jgi:Kef-type K+ transport system membrane component KefB
MKEQLLIMFAVIGGAALVPLFAGRFRIPSAALEILYGVLLFNTLLQTQPEWFILLKELGLIYLMFIVGMELDLRRFVREKNFKWYIAIPLLSFTVTPLIFHQLGYPFFLGVAVAMISAGIIIPVLKESGIMQTDMGRDVLGTGLTGELLSILGLESVKVVLLFALAAFFLRLLYIIAWWNPIKVEKVMESEDPVEIGIRVVMLIALAGSLVAFTSGLEPILGSFMAGLVFSYVFKSKGRFEDKINAVGFGFFTPFFFIGVGAALDINLLKTPLSIQLSLILVVAVFLSNIFPVMFSRFMGLRNLEGLGMSFLLSAPLSLMVVAGTLGVKMGLIDEALRDTLILTAVLSSIIFPSLFRVTTKKLYQHEEETVEPERTKV